MDDNTIATALKLADDRLKASGWKYLPEDIGKTAAKIINALIKELEHRGNQS